MNFSDTTQEKKGSSFISWEKENERIEEVPCLKNDAHSPRVNQQILPGETTAS